MIATLDDLALAQEVTARTARRDLFAFRRMMRRYLIDGWFVRALCDELERFREDMIDGQRPLLILETPPQHGKSEALIDFIAWCFGLDSDLRTIYASYSDRIGVRANKALRRQLNGYAYQYAFPETRIVDNGDGSNTQSLFDLANGMGFFRNTTVRGSITGDTIDLGIIDDPIKGRDEASSPLERERVWQWYLDDFSTRLSQRSGVIIVMTRWHLDDLAGRIIAQAPPNLRRVSFPAIATQDEPHRKIGDALFPELKSIEFLNERQASMARSHWLALYQQSPTIEGGVLIRGDWFERHRELPPLEYRCIYADTAQKTKEHNDFSVLQCWGKAKDGRALLIDQARGKWEAPELSRRIVDFWAKHNGERASHLGAVRGFYVEDASSGTGLIQDLRRRESIPVIPLVRDRDKFKRLCDVLGYLEARRVSIPEDAPWINDFIAECELFSAYGAHIHDDQIDPMIDAIKQMLANPSVINWAAVA